MARRTELRVGMFVLFGLSMVGLIVFTIGDARRLFDTKTTYHATFTDVEGLARGSSIRMGGVTIGRVTAVSYETNAQSPDIHLELTVVESEGRRIREDSTASIAPKGMLGDKMLVITVGSADLSRVPSGGEIKTTMATGILSKLKEMSEQAQAVVGNLEKTTGTFAEEDFRRDLSESASSIRNVLHSIEQGKGYVPKLLNDEGEAEKLSRTLTNLERSTARLDSVLAGLQKSVKQINEGPGTAHELLYGDSGVRAATKIGDAAQQVALVLEGIKQGDGLVKELLYGGKGSADSEKVLADLAAITGDFRAMTAGMREGKGTLGALMVDPSVYEDLKVLLGNVQRNSVLRSLVRYSIQQDERAPRVENPDHQSSPRAN